MTSSCFNELLAELSRILLAVVLLASVSDAVADNSVGDHVLAAYDALDSYCDTVAVIDNSHSSELHRCYTREGRYKRSELFKPSHYRNVQWGDAEHEYFLSTGDGGSITHYMEEPARNLHSGGPPDGLAARAISAFLRMVENEDSARSILRGMEVIEDGSEYALLQHRYKNQVGNEVIDRIWIRRADGFVVRAEKTVNGQPWFSSNLVESRINQSLSQGDLDETVPFFVHYSLKTHPGVFTCGLAMASFVAGLVLSVLWRRPRNWQRNWLRYSKGIVILCVFSPVLFVLSILPPTGLEAMVLSLFVTLAAIALAALMLGMQLSDRVHASRLSSGKVV